MSKTKKKPEQSIEELQQRYSDLNTRKIQAETKLDDAQDRLKQLKSQAQDKYGTDDLEQLREKLAEMKSENEKKRRDYQENLDQIETDLNAVDEKFAAAIDEDSDNEET